MDTAEKVGLLPGSDWMAGHGLLATIIIVMAVTPGMMFVIGIIGESRWLPISPKRQFLSFFPGDILLGATVAGLLVNASHLPVARVWYNSVQWHIVVLIGALVVASGMTYGEYRESVRGQGYARCALFSPTKLYHNFGLYGGLGYVGVSALTANIAGLVIEFDVDMLGQLTLCLLPGAVWLSFLFLEQSDSFLMRITGVSGDTVKATRIKTAHVANWRPIWAH